MKPRIKKELHAGRRYELVYSTKRDSAFEPRSPQAEWSKDEEFMRWLRTMMNREYPFLNLPCYPLSLDELRTIVSSGSSVTDEEAKVLILKFSSCGRCTPWFGAFLRRLSATESPKKSFDLLRRLVREDFRKS